MHYILLHFIKPCDDEYSIMYTYVHISKSVSVFILPSIQTAVYTIFVTIKGNFPYPCHNVPTATNDIPNNKQISRQEGQVMKFSIT